MLFPVSKLRPFLIMFFLVLLHAPPRGEAMAREQGVPVPGNPDLSGYTLRPDPKDGTVWYLEKKEGETGPDRSGYHLLADSGRYGEAALRFIDHNKRTFRLADPERELKVRSVREDELGYKHVRLSQSFSGVPVHSAEIIVHFDKSNGIYLVFGRYMPTPVQLHTDRALPEKKISNQLSSMFPGATYRISRVIFYDRTTPRLAYLASVSVSLAEGWEILLDAETGAVLQKVPTVYPH